MTGRIAPPRIRFFGGDARLLHPKIQKKDLERLRSHDMRHVSVNIYTVYIYIYAHYTYIYTYIYIHNMYVHICNYIYMIGFHHVPVMIYTNSSPLCSKIPPKSLFLIDAKLILKERHLDPPKNQISSHLGELYPLVNVYKKLMGKSPCDFHG